MKAICTYWWVRKLKEGFIGKFQEKKIDAETKEKPGIRDSFNVRAGSVRSFPPGEIRGQSNRDTEGLVDGDNALGCNPSCVGGVGESVGICVYRYTCLQKARISLRYIHSSDATYLGFPDRLSP